MMRPMLCCFAWSVIALHCISATAQIPVSDVSRKVDGVFERAWKQQGVKPAAQADDATFLRRVTLDLTGMLPAVAEVRAFLADDRDDKRSRWIQELLTRSRHANHLANIRRDVLLPRNVPQQAGRGLEDWLRQRFRENKPYDQIVREVLLAEGGLDQSPPVVYYAALDSKPEQLAASVSSVFLAVQIRCAECHDHPFAQWEQEDFWSQAAFFARVRGPSREGGISSVQEVSIGEVSLPSSSQPIAPRFLDGQPAVRSIDSSRREQLARWITAPDNQYFARATVNRVWHVLFGRGLVDPVDDQGAHNPPTHPEALDVLADDFVNCGYDLRRLIQVIAETDLYQRASTTDSSASDDALKSYTSMPVRSLSAKQLFDCLLQASRRREPLDPNSDQLLEERVRFLASVEAPTVQATEFQGGIPQTLTLLNGDFVNTLTDPDRSDLIAALADSPFLSDRGRLETLYLATVSRMPSDDELSRTLSWVTERAGAGDKAQALSDVLWALLNSSEFMLIQ